VDDRPAVSRPLRRRHNTRSTRSLSHCRCSEIDSGFGPYESSRVCEVRSPPPRVTGVGGSLELEEDCVHFAICFGAVLDAFRDHEHIVGSEYYIPVAELDCQLATNNGEELIGVGVCVCVCVCATRIHRAT
jgi:hypothetical protein